MLVELPYFMKNDNWYYFDIGSKKYKLTEEAPEKAIKSYDEFYKEIGNVYGN